MVSTSVAAFEKLLEILKKREEELHDLPIRADPEKIQAALEALPKLGLPDAGLGTDESVAFVERVILPGLAPGQSGPRYFGFVTGGTVPAALHGDFLTSVYDSNVQVNLPGDTISTIVEAKVLEMLLDLLDLPRDEFPGRTITTGATASNVIGLACGREFAVRRALGDPNYSVAEDGFGGAIVQVLSDRPHASLVKAASLVGIGRSNVVDLFNPKLGSMDLKELEIVLSSSSSSNHRGFIVSPSFGEVTTGQSTANVVKIRELCDRYHAWLHIDAAFGAFSRLVPELRDQGAGLELADSITSDGHKWLNVPYDAGLFFCRDLALQTSIFGPSLRLPPPAYLTPSDAKGSGSISAEMLEALKVPSPLNIGIENSRRFRALPIFCALLSLGREGYVEIIRRNVQFARRIGSWMSTGPGSQWYEVLNLSYRQPVSSSLSAVASNDAVVPLNIVLFRARGQGDNLKGPGSAFDPSLSDGSTRLVQAINDTQKLYVSPAKNAARIAVSNWMTGLRTSSVNGQDDFEIVTQALTNVMIGGAEM